MADFTLDDVADNAAKPASTTSTPTSTSVSQHPLEAQLEVADRQAAANAVAKPHRGIFFSKLIPGGPNG